MKFFAFVLAVLLFFQIGKVDIQAQNTGRPIFQRITLYTAATGMAGALAGFAMWVTDPLGSEDLKENVLVGAGVGCFIGFGIGIYQAFQSTIPPAQTVDDNENSGLIFDDKSLLKLTKKLNNPPANIKNPTLARLGPDLVLARDSSIRSAKRYNLWQIDYRY